MPSVSLTASERKATQQPLLPVGTTCEVVDASTGGSYSATILSRRWGSSSNPPPGPDTDNVQYYIHRHDQDKRMDGWVDHTSVRPAFAQSSSAATTGFHSTPVKGADSPHLSATTTPHSIEKGKRKAEQDLVNEGSDGGRTPSASRQASPALLDRPISHRGRQRASSDTPALRNIDRVLYGNFDIKTWYYSPYPLDHDDEGDGSAGHSSSSHASAVPGVSKRHQSPSALRLGNGSPAASKRNARKDGTSSLGGALSSSARDAPAIKALACSGFDTTISPSRGSPATGPPGNARGRKDVNPTKMLWICDGCFKYMKTYNGFAAHRKFCRNTHPPGRKVYQRGAHIIWEVDGAAETLYCQNLSLFGKLFIDHKTIYFDVEPFKFYVLTDAANASFDHPLGFFSKEKVSYDDYNLACIVTFPPFQRKSFGTLMIEFSYYLSAAQGMLGTPERPLSDLGFKGYLSFWTAVLLRALVACFDGPLRARMSAAGRHRRPSLATRTADEIGEEAGSDSKLKAEDALRRWQILSQRCKLLNIPIESISHQPGFAELQQLAAEVDSLEALGNSGSNSASASHKRRLHLKGWAGSTPTRAQRQQYSNQNGHAAEEEGVTRRSSRVAATAADGKGAVHPALDLAELGRDSEQLTMAVTIDSLSRLTHLRSDDIVLALSEAGLVSAPDTPFLPVTDEAVALNGAHASGSRGGQTAKSNGTAAPGPLALLLTRDAMREAITRFNVRPAVLDESYALI